MLPTSSLPWLLPLLSDRMVDVRFCGWAITTALVCDEHGVDGGFGGDSGKGTEGGRNVIISEFQNLPGGLWAASLGVVLDEKECFAVRTQVNFPTILLCFFYSFFSKKTTCGLQKTFHLLLSPFCTIRISV